ncbi:MAG: hypothetical protein ACJAYG_001859, partial [Oceanicoccus sp.]
MRYLFTFLQLTFLLSCDASAQSMEQVVADFSQPGSLQVFQRQSFEGDTVYKLVALEGEQVLRATTDASASALYQKLSVDLQKTPFLNWRWRVDNVYGISDQQAKAGDDYPARIYVVVKQGIFPWQSKALNYVWSNTDEAKSHWPNPFAASAIMIPLRSAADGLGRWHLERVNVAEDFYRVFGERITRADAVAIMSDSDNAGGKATAYYGDI